MCNVTINIHLCSHAKDSEKVRTWCSHASDMRRLRALWTSGSEFFSDAQRDTLVELRRKCVAATEIWRARHPFVDCTACVRDFERLGDVTVTLMAADCLRLDTPSGLMR